MDKLCLRYDFNSLLENDVSPFPAENTPVQAGVFSAGDMEALD